MGLLMSIYDCARDTTMEPPFALFHEDTENLVLLKSRIRKVVESLEVIQRFLIVTQAFFSTDRIHSRSLPIPLNFQIAMHFGFVTVIARILDEGPRFVSHVLHFFRWFSQQLFRQKAREEVRRMILNVSHDALQSRPTVPGIFL